MKRSFLLCALLGAALTVPALPACGAEPARAEDPYTFVSQRHLVRGFPARPADDRVNVVVEIPAGTNAKWEVDKASGNVIWEFKEGKPRVVRYLPYPANYGMVPQTLLPKELGGDGDPLDVVLLGPAVERGEVVQARLVGVLLLLDGGEQDDKLLAVASDGVFSDVQDLADLDRKYPDVTTILETWFSNYKGPGEMESTGFDNQARANAILEAAMKAYAAATGDGS